MKNTLKNKKKSLKLTTLGFTLIELLAVIVILAIIAVIATPIILGIVENTRKEAFQRSVELVEKATSLNINNKIYEDEYTYTLTDGVISDNVAVTNTEGMNGVITYDRDGNVNYAIYNDKWCVVKEEDTTIKDYVEGECTLNGSAVTNYKTYVDGTVVYYDVLTGESCTNYHEDNSLTGYNGIYEGDNSTKTTNNQNSCLKFYTFNDDEGDTILNLLLDHNAIGVTTWVGGSSISNENGPSTALTELYSSTSLWVGTNVPADYTVTQTDYGNYTIDYDNTDDTLDYKARLITAKEVAEIAGVTNFNDNTTSWENWFYFDSLTTEKFETCKYGNTTGCSYGWLYDRSFINCANYGCLNNADSGMSGRGYWTATSTFGDTVPAWAVMEDKFFRSSVTNMYDAGIRPVIEVNKEVFEETKLITINPNGGSYGGTYQNTKITLLENAEYELETPTKEGYVFEGWLVQSGNSSVEGNVLTVGSIDTTVTAKWIEETYVDGTPIYYDVLTGKRCITYNEDNSITGYNGIYTGDNSTATTYNQNSCLKFYAFNYDEGETVVNLLLDHNTTAVTYWTNAETTVNTNGPIDVISQLKIDTSSWIGTQVPSDYTVTQTGYGNYTIDYDNEDDTLDYKARLITANEIAEITGADTKEDLMFDESTTSYENLFYFDSLSKTASDTCTVGNTTGCSYGWLYDRTYTSCTNKGCLNNATGLNISEMYGYWTGTSAFGSTYDAWFVYNDGFLYYYNVNRQNRGVRPVIEVNIDNL